MFDVYLACLSNAVLHRRAALQLELSVGLCVALDLAHDPASGRVSLTNVYAAAGYQCIPSDGADYKTVNRRVNAAFLLFEKLGAEVVVDAVSGKAGHRRVEAVQELLAPLQLNSIDDVLAFCGRPRPSQRAPRAPLPGAPVQNLARRAVDQPGVVHIKTEHVDLPIPPGTTRVEIMALVTELLKIANTFDGGRKVSAPRPPRERREDVVRS